MSNIKKVIENLEDLKNEISNIPETRFHLSLVVAIQILQEQIDRNKACVGCKYEFVGHPMKKPLPPCDICERRFEDFYEEKEK
ncbi:hypothetical protein [Anaerovorax sp. IOR16]|uniref:hypothetical protein n=1 Tax=Anaerovorax sp. IOR16 TaxID=2773458 RepID=UPI0019D17B2C|nr:hypothetical protein [Anaerovorax sp. IOR16]